MIIHYITVVTVYNNLSIAIAVAREGGSTCGYFGIVARHKTLLYEVGIITIWTIKVKSGKYNHSTYTITIFHYPLQYYYYYALYYLNLNETSMDMVMAMDMLVLLIYSSHTIHTAFSKKLQQHCGNT